MSDTKTLGVVLVSYKYNLFATDASVEHQGPRREHRERIALDKQLEINSLYMLYAER